MNDKIKTLLLLIKKLTPIKNLLVQEIENAMNEILIEQERLKGKTNE